MPTPTPLCLLSALLAATTVATDPPAHDRQQLFVGGTEGYHSYRIPALVTSTRGTLLAFCEGRKNSPADYGDIDLVLKRSEDHGATWSPLAIVCGEGGHTWGNPTPVTDRETGRIWLFFNWNAEDHNQFGDHGYEKISAWGDRRLFVTFSDDDGVTWAPRQEMTESLTPKHHVWDAVGPGNGIQTVAGPKPGRLIIPAIGRNLFSDDHGASWQVHEIGGKTSEATIVELSDGRLLRNDRSNKTVWSEHKRRLVSVGQIGERWGDWHPDAALPTPRCQASSIRYAHDGTECLLFLNPATTTRRRHMRVRVSTDDGATWERGRFLPGPGAPDEPSPTERQGGYSGLTQTAEGGIAALVEWNADVGDRGSHKSIALHRFTLDWIADPK